MCNQSHGKIEGRLRSGEISFRAVNTCHICSATHGGFGILRAIPKQLVVKRPHFLDSLQQVCSAASWKKNSHFKILCLYISCNLYISTFYGNLAFKECEVQLKRKFISGLQLASIYTAVNPHIILLIHRYIFWSRKQKTAVNSILVTSLNVLSLIFVCLTK